MQEGTTLQAMLLLIKARQMNMEGLTQLLCLGSVAANSDLMWLTPAQLLPIFWGHF